MQILVQRRNWSSFLRKLARRGRYNQWLSLSGNVERIFEEEDVGFNRTAIRATQLKLQSMFCALLLKIALSAYALQSRRIRNESVFGADFGPDA